MIDYEISFNASEYKSIKDFNSLESALIKKCSKKYRNREALSDIKNYNSDAFIIDIKRKSIDARHKPDIKITYRFNLISKKSFLKHINELDEIMHLYDGRSNTSRPIIVGMGPCGLFAAYILASNGFKPLLIDRGSCIEDRVKDIEVTRAKGTIKPNSNIQFGEGGAGTFSDGKLFSGVSSEYKEFILRTFVKFGAPEDIIYDSNPHIGTDILQKVIVNMRQEIIKLGAEVRFNTLLTDIDIRDNSISKVTLLDLSTKTKEEVDTQNIILALGHSSRDTIRMLFSHNLVLENKPFAVGVRIEHLRKDIDVSQYGFDTFDYDLLSSANYKLAVDTDTGKKLYTFCMCPGGEVVSSASDDKSICTNGMSYRARNLVNSNSALLVPVDENDYGKEPLSGIKFQEELEHKAFVAAGSNGMAPIMTYKGLKENNPDVKPDRIQPSFLPGTTSSDFKEIFPDYIVNTLIDGIDKMGNRINGFNSDDAVLTAVEARSSSPVRILRDSDSRMCVNINGIYPSGEGAGYAGGIMSSAIDGIKTALKLCEKLNS